MEIAWTGELLSHGNLNTRILAWGSLDKLYRTYMIDLFGYMHYYYQYVWFQHQTVMKRYNDLLNGYRNILINTFYLRRLHCVRICNAQCLYITFKLMISFYFKSLPTWSFSFSDRMKLLFFMSQDWFIVRVICNDQKKSIQMLILIQT